MKMKKYIKNLITLINYERDAEIDLMTREISTMSGQKREELGRAINKVKGKSLPLQKREPDSSRLPLTSASQNGQSKRRSGLTSMPMTLPSEEWRTI